MKNHLSIPAFMLYSLLLSGLLSAATPEQEKAFVETFKKAAEKEDEKTLLSFHYTKGADPRGVESYSELLKSTMGLTIKSIELSALTDEEVAMIEGKLILPDGIKTSKYLVIETVANGLSEISRIPVGEKDGKLIIPVPTGLRKEATAPPKLVPPKKTSWVHDGATPEVVTVLAESGEFFHKPGIKVKFFDQQADPETTTDGKYSAEIFFPKSGDGYGKPISITFTSAKGGEGRFQESSGGGYNGQLVFANGKVSGWVNIQGLGPRSESSIAAKFEAVLRTPENAAEARTIPVPQRPAIPEITPDPAASNRPPSTVPTETPAVGRTLADDKGTATVTLSVKDGQATYTFRPAAADGQDAMILRYDPDPNYAKLNKGQETDLPAMVWTASSKSSYRRSLIQFKQLSFIPAGAKIVSAQLTLYGLPADGSPNCKQGNSSGGGYQDNDSYLQMVTKAWNENSVTWANQPSVTDAARISLGKTSNKWSENKTIDLKNSVQAWVNGTPNHGMMLLLQDETPLRSITFGSSENEEAFRPKLVVVCVKGS